MKNTNILSELYKGLIGVKSWLSRGFVLFSALFTLGVGQVWGAESTVKGGYIYFDEYNSGYTGAGDMQFWVGHSGYSCSYSMSKVTNTKLWYCEASSWGDASYFAFTSSANWPCEGNDYYSRITTQTWKSGKKESYTINSGNYYVFKVASTANKAAVNSDSPYGHQGTAVTSLNKTITIKAKVSTDNGGSYSESTAHGKLTGKSKTFTAVTTCTTAQSATLNDGTASTTMSCGYTAETVLTAADKDGYAFKGWYNSSGTQLTTNKNCTIYVTGAETYYAYYNKLYTISASSTVVWDLCGNEKSWSAVYLYRDIEGGSATNDAFTQCGTTTQYSKTYASAVNNMKVFLFRSNTSNWNDYTHTTDLYRDVSGVTLFEYDGTDNGGSPKKLNWQVTTGAKKATSGTKVYFDNTNANWGEIWLKYGTTRFNRHTGAAATKVTGTANLYVITMPEAYYVNWYFASSYGWTARNTIVDTHVGKRIPIQSTDLTSDITFVPTGSTSGSSPTQYAVESFTGHTRRLTFGSHTNGQITVRYTDESGVEQTVSSASASYVDVAQTCQVIITAVPNSGYAPSTLTLGGAGITSGAQQIIRADGTIAATFVAEETHNVTISYKYGTRALHDNQVFEVGVTTASDINAEVIDGFSFSSWSNLTNVTNNTGNLTTNPISINTIVSGSDGSMTCNYTPWTCSLDLVSSEGATGHSSRTEMNYDATEKAYYINRTTASATERYRFFINSIEYSTSGNTELTIDETKVDANTNVTNYASNKPSVYFNDGPSGSNITIWFDYETKKAWVTEQKHTVTISAGANGSVSPTSVSAGAIKASPSITATPNSHYHLSSWTIPSGVTLASGTTTTSPITIKATADDKIVTANFAGDQYTISYKDQNNVAYSGNNEASLPKTHTYGTATALVNGTKTGYNFVGWYTDESCTSSAGSSIGATAKTASFTLYAKWTAINYTADNNLKNADNGNNGQYNVTYDNTSIAHTVEPNKTGYTLQGYYKEAACTNLIANADRTLCASTSYTTAASKWNQTSAPVLYIKWSQDITLDANTGNHGSGDNKTATIVYNATAVTSITHTTAATGYHLEGYYTAATDGVKVLDAEGAFASSAVTDYITDGKWIKAGATTLYAHYAPNTYDVILNVNGATTGSNQTVVATFDAAMPTTQKTSAAPITAPSKTGYTFGGYWTNAAGTGTQYYTSGLASNHVWDVATNNTNIYAKWTPNNYTVTLDKQTGVTGYGGNAGTVANQTVTFDAAPATVSGTMPTAAQGYCFMGFYSETGGNGRRFIDPSGNWVAAAGDTISGGNWVKPADITLYAYYKKAEITRIDLDAYVFDPVTEGEGWVIANPTIEPTPAPTTIICWELLYDNNNPVEGHNAVPDTDGSHPNRVKFSIAGLAAGSYKVKATLRTGSSCDGGTILDTREVSFSIASGFTVTIQYKDAAGNTIASSATSPGKATEWTSISAPTIVGYNFSTWVPGDGITLESPATTNSNQFKATFNGTLTAQYTKKRVIYFNNTLNWSNVYVYFYSGAYWDGDKGTGSETGGAYTGIHGQMQPVSEGSKIYYFDADAAGVNASYTYVAFTELEQTNYKYFAKTIDAKNKVAYRTDYKSTTLPMFVPLASQTPVNKNTGFADYYNEGYWMNYPENTGYSLHIYNAKTGGVSDEMQSIPFEFTADKTLPMTIKVELNANREYGYEIHRADGAYFGKNTKVLKINDSGDETPEALTQSQRGGLKTSVAGDYEFTLSFGNNDGYKYLLGVHYPVAQNDYRIVYTESGDKLWSGNDKPSGWYHPSRAIHKEDGVKDIVSFFVKKDVASMKFQYASEISEEGVVTWTDVEGGGIDLSSIENTGVYNFHLTQADGSISVEKIEAYTGNYYIRTDCAGSTKWENFRSQDHQMTYSSFSESAENSFGEKFSHYYTHWCPAGMNVKFCIANDYSMCITDTLEKDVNEPYKNIATGGNLLSDGNGDATVNRYSANIRFMWDRKTNKISRAYVASSTNPDRLFLVLHADQTLRHDDDTDISSSSPLPSNSLLLSDKENWIYETSIKIKPGTRFKLFASYALETPDNMDSVQFFRGAYDDNRFTSDENSVILIGGESVDYQLARIVYDFKTNRLLAAWLPSGEVDGNNAINADVMIIREHQESARCITFATSSANLSGVKTVYGVMKFNRWILNNRGGSADEDKDHARPDHIAEDLANYHAPLTIENQKSTYERRLYFISFPFNVRVGDIFGFGQYGSYWVLQYYDGLSRAKNGYWLDSKPNWKYISPTQVANGYTLEANQGYLLELNLSAMAADNTTFWSNGISTIELYFPSTVAQETLKQTNCTIPALNDDYKCTINRGTAEGDRRVKDSYWRCIGVPSYNLYNSALKDGSGNTIEWKTDYTWQEDESEFPFIYMWNKTDNTLTPQSTSAFLFQPMHAYLTQIKSAIVWNLVSATPSSIVARRARKEANNEHEWRIELRQDTTFLDQTYVRMTNLEQVTDSFDFGQDLVKELNSRSNIYTFIGYEKVAANSMTIHTDQTTVIPVGANIRADGEYTFAMPEGTNGVGITLIDTEANVRTSLSALDYTVTLSAGEYTNRFFLEISPVQNTPTGLEEPTSNSSLKGRAQKKMIDGILYIVRDGKMYDARGARVE